MRKLQIFYPQKNKSQKTTKSIKIIKKVLECTFFMWYNRLRVKKHVGGSADGAMNAMVSVRQFDKKYKYVMTV